MEEFLKQYQHFMEAARLAGLAEQDANRLLVEIVIARSPELTKEKLERLGLSDANIKVLKVGLERILTERHTLLNQISSREQTSYGSSSSSPITREPPRSSSGLPSYSGGSSGGCFIATAAYGNPLTEQVIVLKAFRDNILQKTSLGRRFIDLYYYISPPIATFIELNTWRRAATKFFIWLIIYILAFFSKKTADRINKHK